MLLLAHGAHENLPGSPMEEKVRSTVTRSNGTDSSPARASTPASEAAAPEHADGNARDVLKEYGLRYSRPRELILSFLLEEDRHVSAESLYLDLKQRGEDLSLSTVYLNLSALAGAGLVREFRGPAGQALYDSNVSTHYHVVCPATGEVRDVPAPLIDGVPLSRYLKEHVERHTGWVVDEPRFSLTGRPPSDD